MHAEAETKVLPRESNASGGDAPSSASESMSASMDLASSRHQVGRYELIHKLGHGGMATVFLGRAVGTAGFERLVAVKVIHPHLASEPEFVEMFLDEARIAAKIHHPHVVETLDLGQDDDLFYMVMEYVEGDTLSTLLRQLRKIDVHLPLPAVLQIIADACDGLSAAHELEDRDGTPLELVHRDVSPHNLLVSMDGRVKVVDFGIMKAAGKRSSTLTGQLRGKLAYMSPEQAKGRPVDRRTDIFALGTVMWELLSNERLFAADTEPETLERVTRCEVPSIREYRPELPESVEAILNRALAVDPRERYEAASQMLRDIRAVLRQLGIDEDPREQLAAWMARFFTGRIQYVRAAIRGSADDRTRLGLDSSTARSSGILPVERSRTTPLSAAALASNSDAHPLTPSTPSDIGSRPSQTFTTALTGPVAVTWTRWLLLPLIGAAIATAIIGLRREPEPKAAAVHTQPEPQPRPEPIPVTPPPAPESVKWWFNGVPQGAVISIDGREHASPTPTSIELPRSESTVEVVIRKDGFAPWKLRLAPLGHENHYYRLEAAEEDPQQNPRLRLRSKPRRPTKAQRDATKGEAKPTPTTERASDRDPRTLEEMPDFRALAEKQAGTRG